MQIRPVLPPSVYKYVLTLTAIAIMFTDLLTSGTLLPDTNPT